MEVEVEEAKHFHHESLDYCHLADEEVEAGEQSLQHVATQYMKMMQHRQKKRHLRGFQVLQYKKFKRKEVGNNTILFMGEERHLAKEKKYLLRIYTWVAFQGVAHQSGSRQGDNKQNPVAIQQKGEGNSKSGKRNKEKEKLSTSGVKFFDLSSSSPGLRRGGRWLNRNTRTRYKSKEASNILS